MKINKVTLLRDLPNVKAGFTFSISDRFLYDYCVEYSGCPDDLEQCVYDEMIHSVLMYVDTDWVKVEPDISKAIQIQCPKCSSLGMFPYYEKQDKIVCDSDVTYWYKKVGLECPFCGHMIHTHTVCVGKKISY